MNEFQQKIIEYEDFIEQQNQKLAEITSQLHIFQNKYDQQVIVNQQLKERVYDLEQMNLKTHENFQIQQKAKEEQLIQQQEKLLQKKEKKYKYLENTLYEKESLLNNEIKKKRELQNQIEGLNKSIQLINKDKVSKIELQDAKQKYQKLFNDNNQLYQQIQSQEDQINDLQNENQSIQQRFLQNIEQIKKKFNEEKIQLNNEIDKYKLKLIESQKSQDINQSNEKNFIEHSIQIVQNQNEIDDFSFHDLDELELDATPDRKKKFLDFDINNLSKRTSFNKKCTKCEELQNRLEYLQDKQQKIDQIYQKQKLELDKATENQLQAQKQLLDYRQSQREIQTSFNLPVTSCRNIQETLENSSLLLSQKKKHNSFKDLFNVQKDLLTRIEKLEKNLKYQIKLNTNLNIQISKIENNYKQQLILLYQTCLNY